MRHCNSRGLTLVELAAGLAVLAIVAAIAVPSLASMFERIRLSGAANELAADLQLARSESVRRRAGVQLASVSDGSGYQIQSGEVLIKGVVFPSGLAVSAGVEVAFDPLRSTTDPAAIDLSNGAGTMRVGVGLMGRVTLCVAEGDLTGYAAC
jgi:type IV fimbrial biogenesis protein FimT